MAAVEPDPMIDVGTLAGVTVNERDHPLQRWSLTDIVRATLGAAVATVGVALAALATDTLAGMQADLARAVGRLPGPARSVTIGVAQLAAAIAPVVLVVAVAAQRRGRMLAGIVVAGAAAVVLTSQLGHSVIDDAQPASWLAVVERESWLTGRAFPTSAYLAGAVAAVVVTVRWLGPRWSRPLWSLVGVFAVVRVVSGTNLPLDLVVAFGVGLAAGSAALLVVGSPDLSPGAPAVVAALRRAGLGVVTLDEVDPHPDVTRSYLARTAAGDVVVDVASETDRDRSLVARAYRRARTRTATGGAPEAVGSVERGVERAAFVALWLDRLGLRVSRPVALAHVGPGAALLAHEPVPGTTLAARGDQATYADLVAAWRAVATLHGGRVAHGALDTDAVVIDPDGDAWLRLLYAAEVDAPEALLLIDRANLLVSTALAVGPERAVAACHQGLGAEGLAATLPYLQIPALPLDTRLRLRGHEKTVDVLRERARAATGSDEVELVRLARVQTSTLVRLAGGLLALVVLLPQVTNLADSAKAVSHADWPWLLPLLVAVPSIYVAWTVRFRAATPVRPPFGLTYLTQLAAATLNRVTPNGIGGMGTNIRFLQRSGYDTTQAALVIALVSLAGGVASTVLIAVFLTWAGQTQSAFPWPSGSVLLVAVGSVLGVVGLVVAVPAARRLVGDRLAPLVRQVRDSLSELAADPSRGAALLGGSWGASLLQLACLWLVLQAFGASLGIAAMGAVLYGGTALAGAAPTPGGVGAVEAVLIGGLSGAGVDPAVATPAVLVFRLLTHWSIVVPGWFALRALRARQAL